MDEGEVMGDSPIHRDAIDRQLIIELTKNARLSYKELAKRGGINQVTAQRRVQRMLSEGTLTFEVVPNAQKLGLQSVTLLGLRVRPGSADQVAERLQQFPVVASVATTYGRYQVFVFAMLKSPAELGRFIVDELGAISDIEFTEAIQIQKTVKSLAMIDEPVTANGKVGVDLLDRRLIKAMQHDVRVSMASLATLEGVNVLTVRRRLKRLMDSRVIAFTVRPDVASIRRTVANIGLRVRTPMLKKVMAELQDKANVRYVAITTGRYDLVLWCFFRSVEEMISFIRNEIETIDGIDCAEPLLYLRLVKWSFEGLIQNL